MNTKRILACLTALMLLWAMPALAVCGTCPSCGYYRDLCQRCGLCACCEQICGCTPTTRPQPTAKPEPTVKPDPTAKPEPTAKPTPAPNPGTSLTGQAAEVVAQTNQERAKMGLSQLTVSSELTRAACVRASEIVQTFSHTRPDGSSWTTASSQARGENIAKGQQTVDKVMAAWMSSQGHRENILRASYGSIGVCALKVGNIMYWVQLFGK